MTPSAGTQQVVEGLARIETRLDGMQQDIEEIKGDVKNFRSCMADMDKRLTMQEKNGHDLRGDLSTHMADSTADRKELHAAAREMEVNWTKLVTVVTITIGILLIFGGKIGEIGQALLRGITGP